MSDARSRDEVNQLYGTIEELYKELDAESQEENFDSTAALDRMKEVSINIGEVTGNYLFALSDSANLAPEDDSFDRLQNIQSWHRSTTRNLVEFQSNKDLGRKIIPRFP